MTELELTANLFKLADMGITGLDVSYVVEKDNYIDLDDVYYTTGIIKESKRPLFAAAIQMLDEDMNDLFREHIMNNIMKTHIVGFHNPDGCSGDIYMWVPSGKYELVHRKKILTHKVSHHNGDLIENTLEEEE